MYNYYHQNAQQSIVHRSQNHLHSIQILKWHPKRSHSSELGGFKRLDDFEVVKKQWGGALVTVKCCCFV